MSNGKSTSPWVWIGCGCAAAIVLGIAVLVGIGVFGVRQAREIGEDLRDPERREERVLEVLGAEAVPDDYHPMMALRVPLLFQMAMLSDLPGDDSEEPQGFDRRGFIFFEVISLGRQRDELEDFFEGRTDDAEVLRRQNINLRVGERLAQGEVDRTEDRVLWVAHRGNIDVMGSRQQGITTLLLFECPGDRRMRMGIWFGPPEDEQTPAQVEAEASPRAAGARESDLSGTNADGSEVEAFVAGFSPCR